MRTTNERIAVAGRMAQQFAREDGRSASETLQSHLIHSIIAVLEGNDKAVAEIYRHHLDRLETLIPPEDKPKPPVQTGNTISNDDLANYKRLASISNGLTIDTAGTITVSEVAAGIMGVKAGEYVPREPGEFKLAHIGVTYDEDTDTLAVDDKAAALLGIAEGQYGLVLESLNEDEDEAEGDPDNEDEDEGDGGSPLMTRAQFNATKKADLVEEYDELVSSMSRDDMWKTLVAEGYAKE